MPNQVVLCHRQIIDAQPKWALESCGKPEVARAYQQLMELCRLSIEQYLAGEFDVTVLTGTVTDRTSLFEQNWHDLRRLVRGNNHAVLWLDSDCLMVQPCDPWHWSEFRLFADTGFTHPQGRFDIYMNCGVKFFPPGMADNLWDLPGEWDHSYYDHEQERYNTMFWHDPVSDWHQPQLNYQVFEIQEPDDVLNFQKRNRCRWGLVEIMHNHASRGALQVLATNELIWERVSQGHKVWEPVSYHIKEHKHDRSFA